MGISSRPLSTPFLNFVLDRGLLVNSLFSLVDVGCFGGLQSRWQALAPILCGAGFDLNSDSIEDMRRSNVAPNFDFFNIAVGSSDTELVWYKRPHPWDNSLLYPSDAKDYARSSDKPKDGNNRVIVEHLTTEVRSLDSLVEEARLQPPNFIKSDTEGYELEVLAGAQKTLGSAELLGLECETCFAPCPKAEEGHFTALMKVMTEFKFNLVLFEHHKVPLKALEHGKLIIRNGCLKLEEYGSISQHDCLFLRMPELVAARSDLIIKMCIIYESYDLADLAIDLVKRHENLLKPIFNTEEIISLLVPRIGSTAVSYSDYQHLSRLVAQGHRLQVETAPQIVQFA